jgi:hypothetical protein
VVLFSVRPSSPVLRRQRERVEAVQSLRSFSAWISIGARLGKKLSVGYGTTPIYQICKVIVDSTLLRFISAGISNELASTRRNGNPKWEHILRMVFLTLAHPARATGGRTYVNSWQMASSRCLLADEKDTFLSLSTYSHPRQLVTAPRSRLRVRWEEIV